MWKGPTETNFTRSSGGCLMSKPVVAHTISSLNILTTSGPIPVSDTGRSSSQSPLQFPASLPLNSKSDMQTWEPEWVKESREFQNRTWPGVLSYHYEVWWNLVIHVWQPRHGRIRCWCRSPISMLVLWKIYFISILGSPSKPFYWPMSIHRCLPIFK